jgi:formyltetrahydrofolate-dependent phosphoribosylglycinamide formyltransferase
MHANPPLSSALATWAARITFDQLPADVIEATKLRVLDVLGLSLAGAETGFGRATRQAVLAISGQGPCHIAGFGDRVSVTAAAFANGAFSQALEFDDTHNESIVHMSSPAVAAALALAETVPVTGRELIAAIAIGNEISCRVGSVSSGELHKRGFHPSGLFATFGAVYLASKLLKLDAPAMARAAGIAGSFASGLLECWVDGTQTKFLHPGWSAQSGIVAAHLARAGATGPARVFEGRWGLFASHLQDENAHRDFSRIDARLGELWESRNSSFKPFPAAHVIHPYITAILRLRAKHSIQPPEVESIDCPVTSFIVPIVCQPADEKLAPTSDSHGRVSLPYSLAEALYRGELGKNAYRSESLRNPEILALARRVRYYVDPDYPGPGRFKGAVHITLKDGRSFLEVEEYNRGSAENPMTYEELRAKFDENASAFLSPQERGRLAGEIRRLEDLPDASVLARLAVPAPRRPGSPDLSSPLTQGPSMRARLGILLSGRGSNFVAIADAIARGDLDAEIAVVISNRADAPGLVKAHDRGLNTILLPSRGIDREAHARELIDALRRSRVDLVCLAGYMRLLSPVFIREFRGRILNVHPSLLPSFPGLDAQRQALDHGVKVSGCTVHFVEEGLDSGPIILQAAVPVFEGDTVESLSARILAEEHRIYPEAIRRVLAAGFRAAG